jgi:hypothetical protein
MFGSFFKRRRLEHDLAKYVSPDRVKAILEGRESLPPSIRSGPIEFVFVIVRADTLEMLSDRMGIALELSDTHGAGIHHIVGSLIVITFGTFEGQASSPELRMALVSSLRERLQSDSKILHGSAQAHYGNLGSATRLSYTFIFPQFDQALAAIGALQWGQIEEFRP